GCPGPDSARVQCRVQCLGPSLTRYRQADGVPLRPAGDLPNHLVEDGVGEARLLVGDRRSGQKPARTTSQSRLILVVISGGCGPTKTPLLRRSSGFLGRPSSVSRSSSTSSKDRALEWP